MRATIGGWYLETDKGTRLYCRESDAESVGLSCRPDSPIAIRVKPGDFEIFFEPCLNKKQLLDVSQFDTDDGSAAAARRR